MFAAAWCEAAPVSSRTLGTHAHVPYPPDHLAGTRGSVATLTTLPPRQQKGNRSHAQQREIGNGADRSRSNARLDKNAVECGRVQKAGRIAEAKAMAKDPERVPNYYIGFGDNEQHPAAQGGTGTATVERAWKTPGVNAAVVSKGGYVGCG